MDTNRKDIDENLLLQYLLGNTDEKCREDVEKWLNADGGNRKHLDRLEVLWLESGKIKPAPVVVDADAAWQRMSDRIAVYDDSVKSKNETGLKDRSLPYRYLVGIAAMVILFVGIYGIYRLLTVSPGMIEINSGLMIVVDTLPDGSRVSLNKNSKLTFPEQFSSESRVVTLSGEAFFEVMHDEGQTFIVNAGQAGVKVLGTSFGVRSYPSGEVEVSVTEGRVMLYAVDERSGDTASVILLPGESGIMKAGALKPVKTDSTSPDRLFWSNRSLDFKGTPLADVFNFLRLHYQVEITVGDPEILDCRLTAVFNNDPVDRILAIIAETFELKLDASGNNFHITGHGCAK